MKNKTELIITVIFLIIVIGIIFFISNLIQDKYIFKAKIYKSKNIDDINRNIIFTQSTKKEKPSYIL